MSAQITLTLPEEVLENARRWANRRGCPVEQILVEVIESSLKSLGSPDKRETPLMFWTDEELLAALDEGPSPSANRRLNELSHQRRSGELSEVERRELETLTLEYKVRLLHKGRVQCEAARRGLRKPSGP